MPLRIEKSDRKLLIISGALLVMMFGASIILAPPAEESGSPVPSTYSAQSAGAEAAYLLLWRLHYPVRRWEDPPVELPPGDVDNLLLILAEPTQVPTEKERKVLADFVKDGGHVLFTGSAIRNFFPEADISSIPPGPAWRSFSPDIPNHLDRGAQHITVQPRAYWGNLSHSQLALYGEPDSTAVVTWHLGNGEILWWAGSTPLTNAGITREDNLAFFLNSVANWSADESYQIYWDEYFHGQRSSLWSYARKSSLAWGLAQAGFLAAAVIFTFSRRSGPIYNPPRVSRLSPLEFVDTLGGLYERAGAASAAVSVSRLRLRSLMARQLGLPSDTPDSDLARAAEERLDWKNLRISDLLGRADNASRSPKLRPGQALQLVQDLEQHAAKLEMRPRFHEEKI
jgi:hypothetical protein